MELINHFWVHFYIALPLAIAAAIFIGSGIGINLAKRKNKICS